MCVIVIKPAGIALPHDDILRACFRTQPDGAGFMYQHTDKKGRQSVRIRKGYMEVADFLSAIHSVQEVDRLPVIMHFRFATHGTKGESNTHPFPVVQDTARLSACKTAAPVGIAHNGIISVCGAQWDKDDSRSDTFRFVQEYLTRMIRDDSEWYEDERVLDLIELVGKSKFAILAKDGSIATVGDFHHDEEDGCYYSNRNYLPIHPVSYPVRKWDDSFGSTGWSYVTGGWSRAKDEDDKWDEMWKERLASWRTSDEDEAGPVQTYKRVFVVDVEPERYIYNVETGAIVSANDDFFLQDVIGNVYIQDLDLQQALKLTDCIVVDESMLPVRCSRAQSYAMEWNENETLSDAALTLLHLGEPEQDTQEAHEAARTIIIERG